MMNPGVFQLNLSKVRAFLSEACQDLNQLAEDNHLHHLKTTNNTKTTNYT